MKPENKQLSPFYLLLASAFVLAGMLVVSLQGKSLLPSANADMVITRANITALTARSQQGEALFVTDNISKTLLVYQVRAMGRSGRIELKRAVYLPLLFPEAKAGGAPRGGTGRPSRVPR